MTLPLLSLSPVVPPPQARLPNLTWLACAPSFGVVSRRNPATLRRWPLALNSIGSKSSLREWRKCRARSPQGDNEDQSPGVNADREQDGKKDVVESNSELRSETGTESSKDTSQGSKLSTGSPLPGVKPPIAAVRLPKGVTEVLRDQVFGFDTFFVTSQEPYEGGVLFQGNLRGEAAKSYSKLTSRLQDKFGDLYKLFLLVSPNDDKPVAVVVSKESLQPDPTPVPEWFAAVAFGLVSIVTILLRVSPPSSFDFSLSSGSLDVLLEGLPLALVTLAVLGAHEAGHYYVAKKRGAELGFPFLIPSWQLGCFGVITRISNILPSRQELVEVAAAGPLAGSLFALSVIVFGFLVPPGDGQAILVDSSAFHESLLVGGIAKAILGDALKDGVAVAVNPIVLAAWTGLLINAINSIPIGELDGGRISQALWGRKVWSRVNGVSVALLGLAGIFNDVALYWVVLVIFLQRGPIAPQAQELTPPDNTGVAVGLAVLILGLLVYFPYPSPFA